MKDRRLDNRYPTIYISLVCTLILILEGFFFWNLYLNERLRSQLLADSFAKIVAQQDQHLFQISDLLLRTIVAQVSKGGASLSPQERKGIVESMKRSIAVVPQIEGMLVFNADGKLLEATYDPVPADLNIADRPFFIHHRDNAGTGMVAHRAIVSRITGHEVLPLTMRFDRSDHSFGGIVVVDLSLGSMGEFYGSVIPGKYSNVTLTVQGNDLLRWPYQSDDMGRGNSRISSSQQVEGYPITAEVNLNTDEMMAEWWLDAWVHLAVGILLVFATGVCGLWLVKRREEVESELHEANRSLEHLATHDELTKISNRRSFDQVFAEEFQRARHHGRYLALIMLDIDHFKKYNDCYGHPAGDKCLAGVARIISAAVGRRHGSMVARYGGEEFVVLLIDTAISSATSVAEEILSMVLKEHLPHIHNHAGGGFLTLSAGVAACEPLHDGTEGPSALLDAADKALYLAKWDGRNCVRCSQGMEEGRPPMILTAANN